MSYTRNFSKTISIPIDVSIKDPHVTSDNNGHLSTNDGHVVVNIGGVKESYSLSRLGWSHGNKWNHHEIIDVNIEVDTDEYDENVDRCANDVNLLTASVAATEAAQVKSIDDNSKAVASTIVKGFFKNVQSEISSQIMELTHKVESKLMHLAEQAKELQRKRTQMENDYRRTASRYTKLFEDLNKELENRVYALDEPIYKFHDKVQEESDRMLVSDFVDVSSIINSENGLLESQIQAAVLKSRTSELIEKTQNLLMSQKISGKVIQNAIVTPNEDGNQYYIPICFIENVQEKGVSSHSCIFDSEIVPDEIQAIVENDILNDPEQEYSFDEEQQKTLLPYLSNEIEGAYVGHYSSHDNRVKEMIFKLFNK